MVYPASQHLPSSRNNELRETGMRSEAVYIIYTTSDTEEKEGSHASRINLSGDHACGNRHLVFAPEMTGL